jgi:hypothetical protein
MDPIILRRKDNLSPVDASYWKDLFYRVIKIGTELEVAPPKGSDRPAFEESVREALHPSASVDFLGENGVWDVRPEHCGIEIRIIGRQPSFRSLHNQYKYVMRVLQEQGSRPRPTCGLHFHVLCPALAEPVPEIILANLWNLTRRYAPELKYLTSCGESRASLCRRRQHNSYLEMIWHSPGVENMAEIQQKLRESSVVPEHQNFLNLEHLGFTSTGAVMPFHLEFRFPDADISPTSVTAKTFLFFAMILKSVDLSHYGVIHVGKIQPWKRKVELLQLLSNNDGNLATSDTSHISDDILVELRTGCMELLDLLSNAFDLGSNDPAYTILRSLADRPVSLMRCDGLDWNEIEAGLAAKINLPEAVYDVFDRRLMEKIEFREWTGYSSQDAWEWQASQELEISVENIKARLQNIRANRAYHWNASIGSIIFIR